MQYCVVMGEQHSLTVAYITSVAKRFFGFGLQEEINP